MAEIGGFGRCQLVECDHMPGSTIIPPGSASRKRGAARQVELTYARSRGGRSSWALLMQLRQSRSSGAVGLSRSEAAPALTGESSHSAPAPIARPAATCEHD